MLKVRIARSWEDQERGLGGVRHLPNDEGMLFEFDTPKKLNFWGKDTHIPLDIAFVHGETIVKISRINPWDLKTVSSDVPANMAIEANAGYFDFHGIRTGDKVDITDRLKARLSAYMNYELDADRCIIRFVRNGHIIEGRGGNKQKEIESQIANVNLNAGLPPEGHKVEKPNVHHVGEPMGQPDAEQVTPESLPVLDAKDIGAKLEDEFDEEEQLGNQFPEEQETQSPEEELETPPEEEQYPVFTNPFAAVEWAEKNNEVVRIAYTTARGRQLTRDVEPHGQFHSKSTHRQILVTWDETVGDIRAFILQNISAWAFVGRQFQKKFLVRG
jgi:uncharacterized membrane protein (UPF0127 family)